MFRLFNVEFQYLDFTTYLTPSLPISIEKMQASGQVCLPVRKQTNFELEA